MLKVTAGRAASEAASSAAMASAVVCTDGCSDALVDASLVRTAAGAGIELSSDFTGFVIGSEKTEAT